MGIKQKNIVAVLTLRTFAGQRKLEGIIRLLNERSNVNLDVRRFKDPILLHELVRQHRAGKIDGVILLHYPPEAFLSVLRRSNMPTVIETTCKTRIRQTPSLSIIRYDVRSLARLAAVHMLSIRPFAAYCCIGITNKGDKRWSDDRMTALQGAFAERGHVCSTLYLSDPHLDNRLLAIPKPASFVATNDIVARAVVSHALDLGLRVPEDISVLGVDDNPSICLGTNPELSSIKLDFNACGYLAAKRLMQTIDGNVSDTDELLYGCLGITARASTMNTIKHAQFVQELLAYVDGNACRGICVSDIAEHFGISRRLLDIRLAEACQPSAHTIIQTRRLREAHRLVIDTDTPLSEIPLRCGFLNPFYAKVLFRATFKTTMSKLRATHNSG